MPDCIAMDRPPRVAVTMTQCWHRVPGGVASSITRLVDAVAATGLVELVAVGPRSRRAPEPWSPSVEVAHLSLPLPLLYDSWHRTRWPAVESAVGPVDVVHHTIPIVPVPGPTPVLATVHDVLPLTDPGSFTGRGARLMRRGLERIRDTATVLVVPSRHVQDAAVSVGAAPGRLHLVPWGVEPVEPGDHEVLDARRRHGLTGDYVLFVGTLEPRKGLDTLAAAIGLLDRPGLTLAVAGPLGWGEVLADELAAVASPVARLGFVDDADLAPLMRGAAAVCSPSRAEGFGLPVLEAMAAGAAVVTTAGTAPAEVAGDAAVLVPPDDAAGLALAIASVLDERPLADRLRAAGVERAASYRWDDAARRYVELYHLAAAGPR